MNARPSAGPTASPGVLAAVAVVASLLVQALVPLPFIWILFGWSMLLGYLALRGGRTGVRLLGVNLAMLLGLLGVGEVLLVKKAGPWNGDTGAARNQTQTAERFEGGYADSDSYYRHDDVLGYSAIPDKRVTAIKYHGDTLLYDVIYTIDSKGLRITPEPDRDDAACILFFGGSFTFGEGVNDEESMPYVVTLRAEGRYRVHNFGFHGYGAHQMLAALESGRIEEIIDCEPRYVFYQAIRAHAKRSAGEVDYGLHAPRYRLEQDGTVLRDGHFDDPGDARASRRSVAYGWLSKSYLFKEIHRGTVIYGEQLELLVSIVDTARREVASRWPGCEFRIILWNSGFFGLKDRRLERALASREFSVHRVGDMLPDYLEDKERYRISPLDRHPNPAAHAGIATYLAREVLEAQD